jgi:hypothetical protein
MTEFDLYGYSVRTPYSFSSSSDLIFALIPTGETPPPTTTFRPILIFM